MVVAAAVAAGALGLARPADAEPTWTAPVQVPPGAPTGYVHSPKLAMNGAGDALIGWTWSGGQLTLTQVASRAHGAGTWARPVTLAEGGGSPTLAIDGAGNALAGFGKGSFFGSVFQAAYRAGPDGAWQEPITVSPAALALWVRAESGAANPVVVSAFRPAGGAGLHAPPRACRRRIRFSSKTCV